MKDKIVNEIKSGDAGMKGDKILRIFLVICFLNFFNPLPSYSRIDWGGPSTTPSTTIDPGKPSDKPLMAPNLGSSEEDDVDQINGAEVNAGDDARFTVNEDGSVTIESDEDVTVNGVEIQGKEGQQIIISQDGNEVKIENQNGTGILTFEDQNLVAVNGLSVEITGENPSPEVSINENGNLVLDVNGEEKDGGRIVVDEDGKVIEANGVSIDDQGLGNKVIIDTDGTVTIQDVYGKDILSINPEGTEATLWGKWTVKNEDGSQLESVTITEEDGKWTITVSGKNGKEVAITYDPKDPNNPDDDTYTLSANGREVLLFAGADITIKDNGDVEVKRTYQEGKDLTIRITSDGKVTAIVNGYEVEVPEGAEVDLYDSTVVIGKEDGTALALGYDPNDGNKFKVWISGPPAADGSRAWKTVEVPEGATIEYGEDGKITIAYTHEGKKVELIMNSDGSLKLTVNGVEQDLPENIIGFKIKEDGSVEITYIENGEVKTKSINPDGTTPEATSRPGYPETRGCPGEELTDADRAEIDAAWDAYLAALQQDPQGQAAKDAFLKWVELVGGKGNAYKLLHDWLLQEFNRMLNEGKTYEEAVNWWRQYQWIANQTRVGCPDPPPNPNPES